MVSDLALTPMTIISNRSSLAGIFFTLFVILVLLLLDPTLPNRFHRTILIPVACIMMTLSITVRRPHNNPLTMH